MNPRARATVFVLAAWVACLPAVAATYRVDDSASQVQGSSVRMKWDDVAPKRGARATVSGQTSVIVRLNVAPWKGRQGRIYMRLPAQPSAPVTASWTTRGPLLPGTLRDGERSLVYAGLIQTDLIEDTQLLTIEADGPRLTRAEQLDFTFEIDVESP